MISSFLVNITNEEDTIGSELEVVHHEPTEAVGEILICTVCGY